MDSLLQQWIAVIVCMSLMATTAVLLRFLAKYRAKNSAGWDDFWVVCSLFCYFGFIANIAARKLTPLLEE